MTVAPMLGVGVIVPTGTGGVLLGRRITAGEQPTWGLPGGKVDQPGESFEQAAARELAEETGIELLYSTPCGCWRCCWTISSAAPADGRRAGAAEQRTGRGHRAAQLRGLGAVRDGRAAEPVVPPLGAGAGPLAPRPGRAPGRHLRLPGRPGLSPPGPPGAMRLSVRSRCPQARSAVRRGGLLPCPRREISLGGLAQSRDSGNPYLITPDLSGAPQCLSSPASQSRPHDRTFSASSGSSSDCSSSATAPRHCSASSAGPRAAARCPR